LQLSSEEVSSIIEAPKHAAKFVESDDYSDLLQELRMRVEQYSTEILIAGLIDNVNVRGRIIEYLISGDDEGMRATLISDLRNGHGISRFQTRNTLGDYLRDFPDFHTATDVKTKVMALHSNPKAYNIDKLLQFLTAPSSVFMFFFIGLEPNSVVGTSLVSVFQRDLLSGTLLLKHWAGRNSRGVAQFNGEVIAELIRRPNNVVDISRARHYLQSLINLGQ
jgi:hypothetical protein